MVLASGNFGAWLDDGDFMSAAVASFANASTAHPSNPEAHVSVLAGVVAGLSPSTVFGQPRQGLSFLSGAGSSLMPDLMQPRGLKQTPGPRSRVAELQSSITFRLTPPPQWPTALELTMPLANTTFVNNRQSTLLASHWSRNGPGSFQLGQVLEKQTQTVLVDGNETPGSTAAAHSDLLTHLVPLTRPRKVAAGWDNILRQIEIDGQQVPASTELESAVEGIFAELRDSLPENEPGPIPVWALVMPSTATGVIQAQSNAFGPSHTAMPFTADLLHQGCRFHRICESSPSFSLSLLLTLSPSL